MIIGIGLIIGFIIGYLLHIILVKINEDWTDLR